MFQGSGLYYFFFIPQLRQCVGMFVYHLFFSSVFSGFHLYVQMQLTVKVRACLPPPPSLMCGLTADSPRRRRACCCTSSSPGKHCRGTTQSFYTADSSSARPSERRLRNQYRGSARARRVIMGSLCFTEAFFFSPRTNSLNGAAEYFNTDRLLIAPTVMIRLIPSSSKFGHFFYLPCGKHCSCAILKLKKKEEGHRC